MRNGVLACLRSVSLSKYLQIAIFTVQPDALFNCRHHQVVLLVPIFKPSCSLRWQGGNLCKLAPPASAHSLRRVFMISLLAETSHREAS